MTIENIGSRDFTTDYIHITFLLGLVVSYLYFRRRHISTGGSLALGYLAASLYAPLNVLATLFAAVAGYLITNFIILKVFLPRQRQIFAIGLGVGIAFGGLWLALSSWVLNRTSWDELALVGVIMPGLICNSLVKQGVKRSLFPLLWMLPVTGLLGFGLTVLTSSVLPFSTASYLTTDNSVSFAGLFALSSASVAFAVAIQESTVRSYKLRTGGYVTVGVLVAAGITNSAYLPVLAVATVITAVIFTFYSRSVPLFGKDRFLLLCTLSFSITIVLELLTSAIFGVKFDDLINIVFCVLPAIIANDFVQYGPKRTSIGMGLSAIACAMIAIPFAV